MLASLSRGQSALRRPGLQVVGNKGFSQDIRKPQAPGFAGLKASTGFFFANDFHLARRARLVATLVLGPIQPRKNAGRRNPEVRIRYIAGVASEAAAGHR